MSRDNACIEDRLHAAGFKTERIGDVVNVHVPVYAPIGENGAMAVKEWALREIRTTSEAWDFIEQAQSEHSAMFEADAEPFDPDNADAYVARRWPQLPREQQRSVASWLYFGWTFDYIGREGEVNLRRFEGAATERGYIRADGVFRYA